MNAALADGARRLPRARRDRRSGRCVPRVRRAPPAPAAANRPAASTTSWSTSAATASPGLHERHDGAELGARRRDGSASRSPRPSAPVPRTRRHAAQRRRHDAHTAADPAAGAWRVDRRGHAAAQRRNAPAALAAHGRPTAARAPAGCAARVSVARRRAPARRRRWRRLPKASGAAPCRARIAGARRRDCGARRPARRPAQLEVEHRGRERREGRA